MSELNKASLAPVDNLAELEGVAGGDLWGFLVGEGVGNAVGVGALLLGCTPAGAVALGIGAGVVAIIGYAKS
jgi:hypothetical protein